MKKITFLAFFAAIFILLSLTVHAQGDVSDYGANDYDNETNGDGAEEIVQTDTVGEDGDQTAASEPSNGYKTALTVIFSSLGIIAAGGAAAVIYVSVKSRK